MITQFYLRPFRALSMIALGLVCIALSPRTARAHDVHLPEELLFERYRTVTDAESLDALRREFGALLETRQARLEAVEAPAGAGRDDLARHALALDALIRALSFHQFAETDARREGHSTPDWSLDSMLSCDASIRRNVLSLAQKAREVGGQVMPDWRTRDIASAIRRATLSGLRTIVFLRGTAREDKRPNLLEKLHLGFERKATADDSAIEVPPTLESLDQQYPDLEHLSSAALRDGNAREGEPSRIRTLEAPPRKSSEHDHPGKKLTVSPFAVHGTITDFLGRPIPHVRVKVWEKGSPDVQLGTVHTNASGSYGFLVTGDFDSGTPEILIEVDWAFALFPPEGASYGDAHIVLRGVTALTNCVFDPNNLFVAKSSDVAEPSDYDAQGDLRRYLFMDRPVTDFAELRQHINDAVDYYERNKVDVDWQLDEDIEVVIVGNNEIGSFYCQGDGAVRITHLDIIAGPGGFISDIYHEIGHLIHHRFELFGLPDGPFSGPHDNNTESDPAFALKEGWASYTAELTDSEDGAPNDNKYASTRDPAREHWRGDEGAPTGLDAGRLESGERVEGAVGGFLFEIQDDPLWNDEGDPLWNGFHDNFRVMVEDRPQNVYELAEGLVDDAGGATTPKTKRIFEHLQNHGIVFSRARFAEAPFLAFEPPNASPPADGNMRTIGDHLFLRGTVDVSVREIGDDTLGVEDIVDVARVRVGYKVAHTGLMDPSTLFSDVTPPADMSFSSAVVALDTETMTTAGGDGGWDLVALSESVEGFRDNLAPSWFGDGNPASDTDEKLLKLLRTWLDLDGSPTTEDDGMVMVDNTAPVVTQFMPQ